MNEKQIQKINSLIGQIMSWQKELKQKELVLSHLYKRLEQLESL